MRLTGCVCINALGDSCQRLSALVEYQREHGHYRVPQSHVSLGRWVSTVRGYRKQGKLSEERIRRLDALGFTWSMPKRPHRRD